MHEGTATPAPSIASLGSALRSRQSVPSSRRPGGADGRRDFAAFRPGRAGHDRYATGHARRTAARDPRHVGSTPEHRAIVSIVPRGPPADRPRGPPVPGRSIGPGLLPPDAEDLDDDLLLAGAIQSLGNNEVAMYKPRWGPSSGRRSKLTCGAWTSTPSSLRGLQFPELPARFHLRGERARLPHRPRRRCRLRPVRTRSGRDAEHRRAPARHHRRPGPHEGCLGDDDAESSGDLGSSFEPALGS